MDETAVIVGLIAAVPLTIGAFAQLNTSRSVGKKNGAGSLQDQVAAIVKDRAAEAEARKAGQHRQAQIEEAVTSTQAMVMTMRNLLDTHTAWQLAHGEADMETFEKLHEAVDHLRALLGEPDEDSANGEALIPYVHGLRHDMGNQAAKDRMMVDLQHQALSDAMAVMREMRARLDRHEDEEER